MTFLSSYSGIIYFPTNNSLGADGATRTMIRSCAEVPIDSTLTKSSQQVLTKFFAQVETLKN